MRTLIGSFVQVIDVMDKIMVLSAGNEWRLHRFHLFLRTICTLNVKHYNNVCTKLNCYSSVELNFLLITCTAFPIRIHSL